MKKSVKKIVNASGLRRPINVGLAAFRNLGECTSSFLMELLRTTAFSGKLAIIGKRF
jgi:hypothetical protein